MLTLPGAASQPTPEVDNKAPSPHSGAAGPGQSQAPRAEPPLAALSFRRPPAGPPPGPGRRRPQGGYQHAGLPTPGGCLDVDTTPGQDTGEMQRACWPPLILNSSRRTRLTG